MTPEKREQIDAALTAPLGDQTPKGKAATATFTESEEADAFGAAFAQFGQQ